MVLYRCNKYLIYNFFELREDCWFFFFLFKGSFKIYIEKKDRFINECRKISE